MRFHSSASVTSALYNAVPHDINSIPTLPKFKAALERFLLATRGQTEIISLSGLLARLDNGDTGAAVEKLDVLAWAS